MSDSDKKHRFAVQEEWNKIESAAFKAIERERNSLRDAVRKLIALAKNILSKK